MREADFLKYFRRHAPYRVEWEPVVPPSTLRGMVVTPVLAELEGVKTLTRLAAKWRSAALALVVNQPPDASEEYRRDNAETLAFLRNTRPANVFWLDCTASGVLPAGVGAARRCGMDMALKALATPENCREKLLISLDGDTLVEANYPAAVFEAFEQHPAWAGAWINFHHRLDCPETASAITSYERYLYRYFEGLAAARSPYAYIPIGSGMAARMASYLRCGGMREKSGGEDFYFMQALRKTGEIGRITATTVHPSARLSGRVPFGTGPRLRRMLAGEALKFETEHAFHTLAEVIATVENTTTPADFSTLPERLPAAARPFFAAQNFPAQWSRILRNTPAELPRLIRAFHEWFDAFRTLKLLHFLDEHH